MKGYVVHQSIGLLKYCSMRNWTVLYDKPFPGHESFSRAGSGAFLSKINT